MPFGEESSNSYGTGVGVGTMNHVNRPMSASQDAPFPSQSSVPLRSRGNARVAPGSTSSSTNGSEALFSHPQSSFDEFPYPPYSELPFTSLKRRKHGSELVKWTMRGVLASPVIVLVLWSVGSLLFSSRVASNTAASMNKGVRTRNYRRMAPPQGAPYAGFAQQPYNMMSAQQQQMQPQMSQSQMQYQLQGQPLYALPPGSMAMASNGQYLMPQQLQQQQPQPMQQMPQSQQQAMQAALPMGDASPADISVMGAAPNVAQPPAMQQGMVVQPKNLQAGTTQMALQQQAGPDALTMAQQQSMMQQEQPNLVQMQQPLEQASEPRTASAPSLVLYYDPKQAVDSKTGELQLPTTAYDAQGNSIDLSALAGKDIQLLMAAPSKGSTQVQEPLQQMEAPKAQLSMSDLPKAPSIPQWGESTAQEQTITMSTMAVMMLLVGAFSARRLRSGSLLGYFIENEAMEDDLAYDEAITTTAGQDGSGSSYNTFGGWKGDLEKFDV